MDRVPAGIRVALAIVAILSRLTPRWRAGEWRHEWEAEIAFRCQRLTRTGRLTASTQLSLIVRCLGAAPHVVWLWWHEWSFDMLTHDIQYAFRTLRARPTFTATAILTLALGIGGATAIFTLVDRLLLRPLPFPNQSRLVSVWPENTVSKRLFAELASSADAFDSVAAYSGWTFTLTDAGEAERLEGAAASAGFFRVLEAEAALGRTFLPDEDRPGRAGVAVISHGLWLRQFAGDPGVLGRRVGLNGEPATIVGVMPARFEFPQANIDIWATLPFDPSDRDDYFANYLSMVGRLKPDATIVQATQFMRAFGARYASGNPSLPRDFGARRTVVALRELIVGDTRDMLLILLAAIGCLLLVGCTNIANLLLARASARRREIAVRSALGASRVRLVRQLLVESTVLASLGGLAGLAVGHVGVRLLAAGLPETMPGVSSAGLDGRVLAFAVAVSIATGLLFGLAPALHLARGPLRAALETGDRGASSTGRARTRRMLVVAEVTMAVALIAVAGLLIRTLWRLAHVEPGFASENVLTLRLSAAGLEEDALLQFQRTLFERIAALPGVTSAGAIHLLPMSFGNWDPAIRIEGVAQDPKELPSANWRAISPGYVETMQIPLVQGRLFTERDDEGSEQVALINRTMASQLFAGQDPVGRRVQTTFEQGRWARIVGVVGDVRQHGLASRGRPEMYRPLAQHPLATISLVIRTSVPPSSIGSLVRGTVATIDDRVPVWAILPLRDVVGTSIADWRFFTLLLTSFAAVALVLGATGIFGVMAYDVSQRRREIGVRLALGADPRRLRRAVICDGLTLAAIGLVLGIAAAIASGRWMSGLLVGVSPADPLTLLSVAALLALVAAASSYVPARRAASVDPAVTLRAE